MRGEEGRSLGGGIIRVACADAFALFWVQSSVRLRARARVRARVRDRVRRLPA